MTRAAHSWYLRNTYVENNLVKPGKITLKGEPIDLGQISQDAYAVGAEKDHIVPWDAAWRITQLFGGDVRFVLASSGHIAGIINPPGGKGTYWTGRARTRMRAARSSGCRAAPAPPPGAHADRKDPVLGGEPKNRSPAKRRYSSVSQWARGGTRTLDFIRALQWRARSVTPGSIGVPLQCRSDPTLGDDRRHARNPRIAPDPL